MMRPRPRSSWRHPTLVVSTLLLVPAVLAAPQVLHTGFTQPAAAAAAACNVDDGRFRPWNLAWSWIATAIGADATPKCASSPSLEDPERFRRARYGNDMVLRFNISTPDEAASFAEACDTLYLDVWESTRQWVDVRVSEDVIPSLLGLLPDSLQRTHMPVMRNRDLLKAIGDSYPRRGAQSREHSFSFSTRREGANSPDIFFNDYRPWDVITHWMSLMSSMFRTHATLVKIGTSAEGRDMLGLRIGVHPSDSARPLGPRRTVLITAGAHAREWISTSTATYIAYSLLTQYGKSATVRDMLEQFDWIFVPSVNPDGYVYTWSNDRLWRKNRQGTSLSFCPGVDLDRSFGFRWSGAPGAGNPCSENYAGQEAFQGHEAKELAQWARNQTQHGVEFVGLVDLHSYSQEVLYPFAFSCSDEPTNLEDLQELGQGLAKAIRRYGYSYSVISACEGNVLQPASSAATPGTSAESAGGSLLDWFYHELGVRLSYQLKLRDTGSWGFLLPSDSIVPVGEEIYDAVLFLGETLLGKADSAATESQQMVRVAADKQQQQPMLVAGRGFN